MPHSKTAAPIFCYVTDRASLGRAGDMHETAGAAVLKDPQDLPGLENVSRSDPLATLLAAIAAAVGAGVHWVQLREKDLAARDLARLTRMAVACSAASDPASANSVALRPRVFVNDRLDVAVAERAAGVHLGENSLPVGQAKRLLRNLSSEADMPELLAGVSCHSLASAQAAAAAGADYIFFGPIFPTPSKQMYGPAQGLQRLGELCCAVNIPVLAIGGVNAQNAADCLGAGASGIAAIRLFQQPHGLQSVASLLQNLNQP